MSAKGQYVLDAVSTQYYYYFEYCFDFGHTQLCLAPPEQVHIACLLVIVVIHTLIVGVVLRYAVAVWVCFWFGLFLDSAVCTHFKVAFSEHILSNTQGTSELKTWSGVCFKMPY